MADPKIAIALTLQHEGGYVNNPDDPGGATNMGIEQRDLPNIPIHTLTVAQAVAYYTANYWKSLYYQISSQDFANKIFDLGVLFGIGTAVKVLQGVLGVGADGDFGPATLAVLNSDWSENGSVLMGQYKAAMHARATSVAMANPKELEFLAGWNHRIDS